VDGTEPDLPELTVQYGDFAHWQQTVQLPTLEAELDYWRERLAGVPYLDLPTDQPRPAEKGVCGAELIHTAGAGLGGRVMELARRSRCTPFMVLLAAVQVLLASYSGQDDICVGSPVGGRTDVDLEQVVGLFANTLALRGDLSGDPTFGEQLRRTRTMVLETLSRQSVPFGRIVAALDVPRMPDRTQVFQVIFNMRQEVSREIAELAGLHIEDFPHPHPKTLHDLVIDIWRLDSDTLRTGFRYDDALFTADTVAAMADRYERLLTVVVDRPDIHLSALMAEAGPARP
jgi:non-ribosomal peptide synthetase component F